MSIFPDFWNPLWPKYQFYLKSLLGFVGIVLATPSLTKAECISFTYGYLHWDTIRPLEPMPPIDLGRFILDWQIHRDIFEIILKNCGIEPVYISQISAHVKLPPGTPAGNLLAAVVYDANGPNGHMVEIPPAKTVVFGVPQIPSQFHKALGRNIHWENCDAYITITTTEEKRQIKMDFAHPVVGLILFLQRKGLSAVTVSVPQIDYSP